MAALLLAAQLLAAGHYHQIAFDKSYHRGVQTVADDGLCALCLYHFNCPASANSPIVPQRPALAEVASADMGSRALHSSVKACLFGRAPPPVSL
ncbi:MAG TPA: hypothetical protein VMD75_03915 [Candidatus Binataceae bacterium]|nr:hypothetical protein [Candidatus Binataceae bacterium]